MNKRERFVATVLRRVKRHDDLQALMPEWTNDPDWTVLPIFSKANRKRVAVVTLNCLEASLTPGSKITRLARRRTDQAVSYLHG